MMSITMEAAFIAVLLFFRMISSLDTTIPSDESQLNTWFNQNVGPLSSRIGSLDPELVAAERNTTFIHVGPGGGGNFNTVTDAIKSVPTGNKNRTIIVIAPGTYNEKLSIIFQPFITLYGSDPYNLPTLVYNGTAAQYGTTDSATLIVYSDYFTMVNVRIRNSSPRPDGKTRGAQAVAFRIEGDKASFYNSRFIGFQDTLLDDMGRHFYKDCYVEGTVDFIFGNAKSLHLRTTIHVIPGDPIAFIAAQSRSQPDEDNGYSFVHCNVTGAGEVAYLGRSWFSRSRVVYSYSQLSDVVNPLGWSDNNDPKVDSTVFFGEYKNKGPGANFSARVTYSKQLSDAEAQPYISLDYIEASKWLLPPPKV